MKKVKLSEARIVALLNEGASGLPIADLCRKYEIANSTYYKLKAKYSGMNISELKRLKSLEEENRKLKQMYADISLEHKILKEVLEKKYPELIAKK
jgi:putative transposase